MALYTKNGRPLQASGGQVYAKSGKYLGRISGNKIYGPNGRYAATIVGDRAVYRSTDSATVGSLSSGGSRGGSAAGRVAGSSILGDEPNFPD